MPADPACPSERSDAAGALTADGFATQAARLRDRAGVGVVGAPRGPGRGAEPRRGLRLRPRRLGRGRLLAALYDGVPAVLAYRALTGATQTVDLLRCGSGEVLRSTVLPVER